MWNAETAQFLHDWYATPEGTYAITQENRLFQHLISQWPRRGHTLRGERGPGHNSGYYANPAFGG